MKDTFYFSHDYNARTDDKIKKLIRKHGFAGYGIYWAIIEDLYNNANALETDYDGIAFDMREDEETIKSIINDFELFALENGVFGSLSVQSRLDARDEKSKKARASAKKRWDNDANASDIDANALQTHSDSNAIKERKGKEIKGKDNKDSNELVGLEFLNQSEIFFKEKERTKRVNIKLVKRKADEFWTNNYSGSNDKLEYNDVKRHFGNWFDKLDLSQYQQKNYGLDRVIPI